MLPSSADLHMFENIILRKLNYDPLIMQMKFRKLN